MPFLIFRVNTKTHPPSLGCYGATSPPALGCYGATGKTQSRKERREFRGDRLEALSYFADFHCGHQTEAVGFPLARPSPT